MANTIGRHFPLTVEQAEWLRDAAYQYHVKQAEIVRYALDAVRADLDGRPRPSSPLKPRDGSGSALGGSLAGGPDLAARLLEERRREERR